ncbi:MAG TPA: helix-turn-helix domain-containing protein [Gaiellaceae bacterium]|jgi:AcrR family transcriptional regulator
MPKVTEAHKEARRDEILEGAQRAFARHGYEGATVARLEEETGLSRGAIFNYFENKDALFVGVVAQSSDRLVEIWLERGFRALLEAILNEDADWLSVQMEATRRIRTDEGFREQLAKLDRDVSATREERYARLRPSVRDDLPIETIAQFLSLLANGLAFVRVTGDPLPDLDVLDELVETGVAPRSNERRS